jgi:hypothetical protein
LFFGVRCHGVFFLFGFGTGCQFHEKSDSGGNCSGAKTETHHNEPR